MKFKFCPNCGHAGGIEQKNNTDYHCLRCGWQFWNNPLACVGVAFIKDGQVLVAKRGIEPNKGRYDLPGGFLDYNEDPFHAVARECQEEMGVVVKRATLIAAYPHEYLPATSTTDLIYVVDEWKGDYHAADDVSSLEWQPFAFIESKAFAPSYPGLAALLKNYGRQH